MPLASDILHCLLAPLYISDTVCTAFLVFLTSALPFDLNCTACPRTAKQARTPKPPTTPPPEQQVSATACHCNREEICYGRLHPEAQVPQAKPRGHSSPRPEAGHCSKLMECANLQANLRIVRFIETHLAVVTSKYPEGVGQGSGLGRLHDRLQVRVVDNDARAEAHQVLKTEIEDVASHSSAAQPAC